MPSLKRSMGSHYLSFDILNPAKSTRRHHTSFALVSGAQPNSLVWPLAQSYPRSTINRPCFSTRNPQRTVTTHVSGTRDVSVDAQDRDVESSIVAPAVRPRWASTPPAMVMNVQARPRPLRNNYFRVNDSPQRLDEAYLNALGRGGDRLLDEEVKWLAVTHKSFDQGRRGFNDRLAYLGKRIVELQTSLAFLSVARPAGIENLADADQFGRMPYRHNALANLPRLSEDAKRDALDKKRVARLAQEWGLDKVTRWKPRRVDNLQSSGLESVLATTVYAIVGAVALQRGGELANAVVRERLMPQLGIS